MARLKFIAGVVSIAGAIAVIATGGGWWAFWPALLGLSLLTGPRRRRYWERVERDDPASVPLQAMWMCSGLIFLALFLGITQLVGLWFPQSTQRGLGTFAAALFFAIGWAMARATRRRLQENAEGETLVSSHDSG